ncbi:MAG: urea transporter, partial [Duncaniella sp.]|nr:urea transporter [Duncaniella sp.]
FMIGIFWGAYAEGFPAVAWGSVVGLFVSTIAGYWLGLDDENGAQGLWGFNGVLVGCAFPTFLGNTVWMWVALIICSALTTWVRTAFNRLLAPTGVSSFTFPFVFCTWMFLLASRLTPAMPDTYMSHPVLATVVDPSVSSSFGDVVIYWLKGIAQVFLINNWVTGIFFLAALAVSSWRAAAWAAIGSAIALALAYIYKVPGADLAEGLYGFSAVLTAIALGATFCTPTLKNAVWAVLGTAVTFFIQAGMNALFAPLGLATLTGPFCVATWLFLIPGYKFFTAKN